MDDDKVQELLGRLDERTERLVKLLEGNGKEGLIDRVDDLESLKDNAKGLLWVSGGSGLLGALSAIYHWFAKH